MPDAQCSLLPAVFFTASALKYGFYSRRFSNSECLDLEFLIYRPSSIVRRLSSFVYRPIIRSSSFHDYFLLKNTHH